MSYLGPLNKTTPSAFKVGVECNSTVRARGLYKTPNPIRHLHKDFGGYSIWKKMILCLFDNRFLFLGLFCEFSSLTEKKCYVVVHSGYS